MKIKHGIVNSLVLIALLSGTLPLLACPDMQGTYKVEEGGTQLYLQKDGTENYKVLLDIPTYPLMAKTASPITDKDRKASFYQMPLPDCTLHIERFGYLMPFTKGSIYYLHFDSQDYEKTINTDYVLKYNNTPRGIAGMSRTSTSLPDKAVAEFSKK
ncbi:hypothetical protein [Rahnella contaminans]|jgi:hypothetical protein|uniref:hypothetical protein n=1 Tax=Rahnella contaminans TaxID=2703882 RepID=UPI003C2D7588